jgi:Zn-dependent protease with chaperone function
MKGVSSAAGVLPMSRRWTTSVCDHRAGLSDPADTVRSVRRVQTETRALLGGLSPLSYQRAVADWLEQAEPRGWATVRAGASEAASTGADDVSGLMRAAYRLDPGGHPVVHAALARAAENLGIRRPVTVYQLERTDSANAGLLERPEELAILLSGNLIALLPEAGLCAVFGHELAHHVLGALDEGRYLVAARLLDVLSIDAGTPAPFLETARRFQLATELFCDRGSVVACGDLHTAVGALVTVATGLADVDPAGYLAQAEAADPLSGSQGGSHPETVLRAWALGRWHMETLADGAQPAAAGSGDCPAPHPGVEDPSAPGAQAARALLRPRLDLDRLDVFDRAELADVTRALLQAVLLSPQWRTDAVLAHAGQFFPDQFFPDRGVPGTEGSAAWGSSAPGDVRPPPGGLSPATRRYLGYVLLDLVAVDPDLDLERSVAAAAGFADRIGIAAEFDRAARAELQLSAAAWKRIEALRAPEATAGRR